MIGKNSLLQLAVILFINLNPLFSQTSQPRIENIQFHFDESIQSIIVTYNLLNFSDLVTYEIELLFVDATNIPVYPQTIAGDAGSGISGGMNKQIVWEIYNDIDGLTETAQPELNIIAVHKIPIDPSIAAMMDQMNTSIAQKYQFKIQRDGLMIFGVGAAVGSIIFKLKADDYIDQQNLAPDYDEYEILGQKADKFYTLSYISGGIAAASIGVAAYQYIRGTKSSSRKNTLRIAPVSTEGVVLAWTRKF